MALNVGERAQYRKVGKVQITEVMTDPNGTPYYRVQFLTGPRKVKDGLQTVWLKDSDRID